MRMCFLVTDVAALRSSFGGVQLAFAAHHRHHDVRFVSAPDLSFLDDNTVLGTTVRPRAGDYLRPVDFLKALAADEAVREEEALSAFDVVFVRASAGVEGSDPDRAPVIDICWRLRLGGTLVINDPEGLRRAAGGMYLDNLPAGLRARTLVSRTPERLRAFLRELDGPAVLKPLGSIGGEKVFYVRRRQVANVNQMISALVRKGYAVAQEYLPEAEQGEKRVLLIGGRPLKLGVGGRTAIYRSTPALRRSTRTSARGAASGALRRRACPFGAVEERLCTLLRPRLIADGLYLATVDIVGDKILSLNVFTPGGLHTLREVYGVDAADLVIRDVERRVRLRGAYRSSADPEASDVI